MFAEVQTEVLLASSHLFTPVHRSSQKAKLRRVGVLYGF